MRNHTQEMATYVGLTLSLGWPLLAALFRKPGDILTPSHALIGMAFKWGVTLVLLLIILFWEGQSLVSIGVRKMAMQDVLWGVGGFFLGVVVFPITALIVRHLGLGTVSGGITHLARLPLWVRVAIVITAGVTEEILFRGYAIERLASLTGHLGLGAAIAYGAFVLAHLPWWGVGGTLQIGVWSLIVTMLYVLRRNLLACMLMHLLNDAYAFILLPVFFSQYLR